MPADHIFICDNGDAIQLYNHKITRGGHIQADDVYIDGNDLDGVSSAVINDRDILKNDGMVAVLLTIDSKKNKLLVPPLVYTRGFAANETLHVVRHAQMQAESALAELMVRKVTFSEIKSTVKTAVSKYIYRKTQRSPMIIPVIMNAE
jgi:ribonuclease J